MTSPHHAGRNNVVGRPTLQRRWLLPPNPSPAPHLNGKSVMSLHRYSGISQDGILTFDLLALTAKAE